MASPIGVGGSSKEPPDGNGGAGVKNRLSFNGKNLKHVGGENSKILGMKITTPMKLWRVFVGVPIN